MLGKRLVQLYHHDGALSYQLRLPAPPTIENAKNHLRALRESGTSTSGIEVVTLEVVDSITAEEALRERDTERAPPPDDEERMARAELPTLTDERGAAE